MDDGSNAPKPKDTERDLLAKIADILAGGGGGGGGGVAGQVKEYTSDPNTEGVLPTLQAQPAVAYQKDGTGPTYTWNTTTHIWQ